MYLNCHAAASARARGPDVLDALDSQSKNALRGCLDGVRAHCQQIALRERVVAFYLRLGLLSRGRTSEALAETE